MRYRLVYLVSYLRLEFVDIELMQHSNLVGPYSLLRLFFLAVLPQTIY